MGVKLIAFDLDGTTIVKHKYLSECNRSARAVGYQVLYNRAACAHIVHHPAVRGDGVPYGQLLYALRQEIPHSPGGGHKYRPKAVGP